MYLVRIVEFLGWGFLYVFRSIHFALIETVLFFCRITGLWDSLVADRGCSDKAMVEVSATMFSNASDFNQDLSGWTPMISSKPLDFDTDAHPDWVNQDHLQPQWGTQ